MSSHRPHREHRDMDILLSVSLSPFLSISVFSVTSVAKSSYSLKTGLRLASDDLNRPMKKKINVAMIGYQFMGRAHSNAWRQVSRFFDTPVEPVMKVVCGRNEDAVRKAAGALRSEERRVGKG